MSRPVHSAAVLVLASGLAACQPTVKIEAPDKPITINLNVHVDQEVRVKVDRELDSAFKDHPELFGPAAADTAKASQ
jgi:hypothetical protein